MDVYQFLWISSFLHHSGLPSILYMEKLNNNWTRFSGARKAACTRLAEPCTHQACLDASQDLRDDTHYNTPVQYSVLPKSGIIFAETCNFLSIWIWSNSWTSLFAFILSLFWKLPGFAAWGLGYCDSVRCGRKCLCGAWRPADPAPQKTRLMKADPPKKLPPKHWESGGSYLFLFKLT